MGYSGGLSMIFPMEAINHWGLTLETLLIYPTVSGFIVSLPQLAKILSEYANA